MSVLPLVQDQVLDHALRCAKGHEVEITSRSTRAQQMRLAEARIIESTWLDRGSLSVRAVVLGRVSVASTTDLCAEGIERCVTEAIERASQAPRLKLPVELPGPHELASAPDWATDEATIELDPATKRAWLAPALEAHQRDGLALAGRFHTGRTQIAIRSTKGVDAIHQGSFCNLALSSLERPAGHKASAFRARLDARIDRETVDCLLAEVREECLRARDPVPVDAGEWDVVLAPAAVGDLLEWLSAIGFGANSVEDGTSFMAGRSGRQITGEAITVVDDGSMPYRIGVPLPFDAEGQPRKRVSLLERGFARQPVYDTTSAARAGCAATGHATGPSAFTPGTSAAQHLHLLPGTATFEELLAQVERGIYVSHLHYVNGMIDTHRAVMTGLIRDAAFLIKDGRLGAAIEPLRFTDSVLEAFARVPGSGGVGRGLRAFGDGFEPRCTVCPHVLCRGLRFTGRR